MNFTSRLHANVFVALVLGFTASVVPATGAELLVKDSEADFAKAQALLAAGETLPAMKALSDVFEKYRSLGSSSKAFDARKQLRALIGPTFDAAVARGDWKTAVQASKFVEDGLDPADEKFLFRILDAHEKAGEAADAVRLCVSYTWLLCNLEPRIYDVQGNPDLLKHAALIVHRNKLTKAHPLVVAYVPRVKGDRRTAIAELEKVATTKWKQEVPSVQSLAMLICGDLWLEEGHLLNALSWYHRATYFLTAFCASRDHLIREDSYYHHALGVVGQAKVLLRQNKPREALDELEGAIASARRNMERVLGRYSNVKSSWQQVYNEAAAAYAQAPDPNRRGPRPYLISSDVIYNETGDLVPRNPALLATATFVAQRDATDDASRNKRAREDKAYLAQEAAKKQRALEESKRLAELSRSSSSGSTQQAFKFDPTPGKPVQRRRCASCLGSGKGNYVTGGKHVELDHTNRSTGRVVDPVCSSCNGNGWR